MAQFLSAAEAVAHIPDGATVAWSGIQLSGFAEEVAIAIEDAFLEKGHPRQLTVVHPAGIGNFKDAGLHHLGHEGLTAKWLGAHTSASPAMQKLVHEGGCQAQFVPQGPLAQLLREIAGHRPGVISKVGLGTFIDPRLEGGKGNSATTEDYVRFIEFDGDAYLFYPAFPVDVAVIRATTADELGNLSMEDEALFLGQLTLAEAAKNSGGIVIAQVKYRARAGSLHPQMVRIPSPLVDFVVVASSLELHPQSAAALFNPAMSGQIKAPLAAVAPLPMDEMLVVLRRAMMEITPGATLNCGFGYPDAMGSVVAQEDVVDLVKLTTEAGAIGGAPGKFLYFGTSTNPEALIEQEAMFDWYNGGGLDIGFLGLAQTDRQGNVNVSRFSGRSVGPGGFIDVSQAAKSLVYCGSLTAGGLEVATGNGEMRIVHEGKYKKFLDEVEQVTFSGAEAGRRGQRVLYVTERAVFELREGTMTLTEIAPGIDLERDVLAQMDFVPAIAEPLGRMAAEIFQEHWGGLRAFLLDKQEKAVTRALKTAKQAASAGTSKRASE
jgi:propionate CoA-transferase